MNTLKFNKVTEEFVQNCLSLLCKKGDEYNFEEDRLKAFKTSAILQDIDEKKALLGYMTKHIISIYDMVNSGKNFSADKWNEKLTDATNYILLLNAMLIEEREAHDE